MTVEKNNSAENSVTRLFIVDDHPVVLDGIRMAFEKNPEFEIAGTASDGELAVQGVKNLNPDIVLMDISLPGLRGVDATQKIRKWNKKIRIVIYTMHSEREYVTALFRIGINGFVLKHESMSDLIRAVKVVRGGGTYLSEAVREVLREEMDTLVLGDPAQVKGVQDPITQLTVREKEIFILLADGLLPRQIAKRLFINFKTVETHKYNLMEKLGVDSIAQLTKIAAKNGLIRF